MSAMFNRYSGVRFSSTSIAAEGVDFLASVIAKQTILWILPSWILAFWLNLGAPNQGCIENRRYNYPSIESVHHSRSVIPYLTIHASSPLTCFHFSNYFLQKFVQLSLESKITHKYLTSLSILSSLPSVTAHITIAFRALCMHAPTVCADLPWTVIAMSSA